MRTIKTYSKGAPFYNALIGTYILRTWIWRALMNWAGGRMFRTS
jgi:hypothetical protein